MHQQLTVHRRERDFQFFYNAWPVKSSNVKTSLFFGSKHFDFDFVPNKDEHSFFPNFIFSK